VVDRAKFWITANIIVFPALVLDYKPMEFDAKGNKLIVKLDYNPYPTQYMFKSYICLFFPVKSLCDAWGVGYLY